MMKLTKSKMRRTREYVLQALYSWQLSGNDIAVIEAQLFFQSDLQNIDLLYFTELLRGVINYQKDLDLIIEQHISRNIHEIGPIEKSILRLSLFELMNFHNIPYKVIINEGIELAKAFGAEDSHKFINAVLDNATIKIRPKNKPISPNLHKK
ncbi:MAG: transcription antitermination factor NusB [Candidatus Dasytiphilus stammeri]